MLSPTQRAVLRALGEDGISGTIAVPANQVYNIFISCPFDCQITGLETQVTAGTLTVKAQNASVDVTGLTAIAVTTALLRTNSTQYAPSVQVSAGALLSLTVSAVAGAADFSYVLFYKRPSV